MIEIAEWDLRLTVVTMYHGQIRLWPFAAFFLSPVRLSQSHDNPRNALRHHLGRGAMRAMHAGPFGVDKAILPIYHSSMDPKVDLKALEAAFQ